MIFVFSTALLGLITTENKTSQTNKGNSWLTGNEALLQTLQKAGWSMFPPPPPPALSALSSVLPTGWELIFDALKVQSLTLGSQVEHSIAFVIAVSSVETSPRLVQVHFQRDFRTKLINSQSLLVIWTQINMLTLEQAKPAVWDQRSGEEFSSCFKMKSHQGCVGNEIANRYLSHHWRRLCFVSCCQDNIKFLQSVQVSD